MNFRSLPLLAALAFLAASFPAAAQVILLDITGTNLGTQTAVKDNPGPYATSAGVTWNGGGGTTSWGTSIRYSDGTSVGTNARVYLDQLTSSNFDFSPTDSTVAGATTNASLAGKFAQSTPHNPYSDAAYGTLVGSVGALGLRVTGLAYGTYNIYVVGAYTGMNATRPGPSGDPAESDIWVKAGAGLGENLTTIARSSLGAPMAHLTNTVNSTWTLNNNYAMLTVTIDETNPALYVFSESTTDSTERRGWLNAVQIVAVPEPGTLGITLLGAGLLLAFRRRRI
jgi:hypothetical protein